METTKVENEGAAENTELNDPIYATRLPEHFKKAVAHHLLVDTFRRTR